jgi:protein TonB
MFSELVESVARRGNTRKSWAVAVSGVLQGLGLVVLILIPLIYTQALPSAVLRTALLAPTAAAPQPAAPTRPAIGDRAVRLLRGGILTEPPRIPQRIGRFEEAPLPPEAPIGVGPIGQDAGVDLFNVAPSARNPVSPLPPAPSAPTRVPVTSTMEEAKLIARVQPVYPVLAIEARIQGNVVLHAIIGKDGGVTELEVVSGHPLLARAALEAVRQWRYSPTLLSGQPVEVETTITVSFVLGQ